MATHTAESALARFGNALTELSEDPSAVNVARYLRASRELEMCGRREEIDPFVGERLRPPSEVRGERLGVAS